MCREVAVCSVSRGSTGRQCGRVVYRAPDSKFKVSGSSPALTTVELFHGRPWFNFSTALVNSQLVCLLPVGIFILSVMSNMDLFVSEYLGDDGACKLA